MSYHLLRHTVNIHHMFVKMLKKDAVRQTGAMWLNIIYTPFPKDSKRGVLFQLDYLVFSNEKSKKQAQMNQFSTIKKRVDI